MKTPTPTQWFIQKLTRDIFLLSLFFWVILFTLELVKTGLVSNYLSLPHMAVGVFILGVIALVFDLDQPVSQLSSNESSTKRSLWVFIFASILLSFIIVVATDLSALLTLLLIFVTVLSLWVVKTDIF